MSRDHGIEVLAGISVACFLLLLFAIPAAAETSRPTPRVQVPACAAGAACAPSECPPSCAAQTPDTGRIADDIGENRETITLLIRVSVVLAIVWGVPVLWIRRRAIHTRGKRASSSRSG